VNDEQNSQSARKPGGWPAWELEADQILSSIRTHVFQPNAIGIVALGQAVVLRGNKYNSYVALDAFLHILDDFLSQLIDWAEQTDPPNTELRKWAGEALADRLQFLLAQQPDWYIENEGFRERQPSDRRHARTPLSYLGWLSGDYLRALILKRRAAGLLLLPAPGSAGNSMTFAELLNYSEKRISWLRKLNALPDFSRESSLQWANVVFERMRQDEQKILDAPEMRNRKTRDSTETRRSGKVRLHDLKRTITKAVIRLASKPVGTVCGITRPA